MGPREHLRVPSNVTRGTLDHTPLVWAPGDARCEAIVIVPAKDEAETIQSTLRALAYQYDLSGNPLDHRRYEVLLLCNNCKDATAFLARDFGMRHPSFVLHVIEMTLAPQNANVGYARRLLMDEACRRLLAVGRPQGIICSTDGDTYVAPTWIATTLDAVHHGADAVGGRILTSTQGRAEMPPALRTRYLCDLVYQYLSAELEATLDPVSYDPWPRHHQYFGASMAITAPMYERVGGLPCVPVYEDIELHRALIRVDARIRHTPVVRTVTSARRTGRAGCGMAATLAGWEALGAAPPPLQVDDLTTLETRFDARKRLRKLWQETQRGYIPSAETLAYVARAHDVESCWLTDALREHEAFGALYEATIARRKEEGYAAPSRLMNVVEVVRQLRARLAPWRAAQLHSGAVRSVWQPLPEVQPVRCRALRHTTTKTDPFPFVKEFVDIVTGQDALIDPRRPVDEEQVPSRYELRRHLRPEPSQIIQ